MDNKSEQLQNVADLFFKLDENSLKDLFLLLQNGFFFKAEVGCTIEDFFLNQLHLSPDYIKTRIQGIFLNGKPTDHIDTAIIRDGARLTLSGTMPGLAGMSLRKGPLAVFRHGITHRETGDYSFSGSGFIQLKILNLLMNDLGPRLLQKGLYFPASDLARYLKGLPEEFWQGCKAVSLDNREVSPGLFKEGNEVFADGMVKFSAALF